MNTTLPPVPAAGTEPELRAFLGALRSSIRRLEEGAAPQARQGGAAPGAGRAYGMLHKSALPDPALYELYDRLKETGRFHETFYDGEIEDSHHGLRDYVRRPKVVCWIRNVGFVPVGELPYAVFMADTGRNEPGIISYADRTTAPGAWCGEEE